jgi:phosphoribosylamine--glycine ligase
MHILLVGGGGREHALAWKIAKSPLVSRLTCTPGNPGTGKLAQNVVLATDDITPFCRTESVDLVVIGPEAPLADGLGDDLAAAGIPCFGPTKAGARIETSKAFVKEIAREAGIPTAAAAEFTEAGAAREYLRTVDGPYVIKADGLAAGKGVVIAADRDEAERAVDHMLGGGFGEAGMRILIEEFLEGTELSVFALTDGETLLPFGAAQDHKRAFDQDRGPNTGGMGGFSPSPLETPALLEQAYAEIIRPTLAALRSKGTIYRGVLYAGLMLTAGGPKLIEYNCRFGDPECQILMRRVRSDIVPALWGAATGRLAGVALDWIPQAAANIVLATQGYPDAYSKGSVIHGLEEVEGIDDVVVFHAGTAEMDGNLVAIGGRVLNVTALGETVGAALDKAYHAVETIDWPQGFYRKDIGKALRS